MPKKKNVSSKRKVVKKQEQQKPSFRLGWRRDLPDHRDHLFSVVRKEMAGVTILPKTDLRPLNPPIFDQGDLGSCTGNAIARGIGFLEIKDKVKYEAVSRLFIYYNERVIEKTVKSDCGAEIRDGIKSLVQYGACSEALWPYNVAAFAKKPTSACYKDGKNHEASAYQRLLTLVDFRTCLSAGFVFVGGISVYDSFMSDDVAKTGVVPMPKPDESLQGGHAICFVGHDDSAQTFLVANSWGTDWGMAGYFTIPYAYITNPHLASDFWTIQRVTKY